MPLSPSHLGIDVVELSGSRRALSVTVPEGVVRAELDRALQRTAGKLKLPGFRKGKAPLAVVERQYGSAVRRDTLQRVIDEAYRLALGARGLQPVGEGELESADYDPQAGLVFRISFDVKPELRLERIGGFRVERPRAAVTAARVDQAVERLREENAVWRPADDPGPPGPGDLVTVRIVPLTDAGEPRVGAQEQVGIPWARALVRRAGVEHQGRYALLLGAGDAEPDVEAAIRSLAPGETRDFTVSLPDEAGAPAPRRLRITLQDRQIRDLPELDDAFARSLGDFADLAALRAKLERDLREQAADAAEAVLRARLLDLIVAANPFDVPESMVERYLASLVTAPPEQVAERRAQLRPEAERAAGRMLVLERIAELHGLAATDADLDARVAEIAARGQVTPAQVRAQLVRTGQLERLAGDITNTKVFDFLKARSEIVDEGEDP